MKKTLIFLFCFTIFYTNVKAQIWNYDEQNLIYSKNGNVGIDRTNPWYKLDIYGNNLNGTGIEDILHVAHKQANTSGDGTAILMSNRYNQYGARIALVSVGSTPGYLNPRLDFGVQKNNTHLFSDIVTRMSILGNGNVGIGVTNPNKKLTVDGGILCKEVEVVSNITPDYVFEKYYLGVSQLNRDYIMPTLEEVEAFTKANHHLPEVPSAKEIQENGLKLKEMSNLLLQKIEELTLYTIEQEKRIKVLEAKLEAAKL